MLGGLARYLLVERQRLESVDLSLAAGVVAEGLRRVLELDVLEFRVLRVKAAEFVEIDREVGGADGAEEGVAHAPQPPEHLPPRLELDAEVPHEVRQVEVRVPVGGGRQKLGS